jgi:hypothetical protein
MISPRSFLKPRSTPLLILAAGLLLCPIQGESQQVQGVVIDRLTRERVVGASVMLLDTTFAAIAGTTANETGAFRVIAQQPGSFFVLTEALAYRPTLDGILDLGEGGSVTVEIYLDPKPIELDSLKVAVERVETFRVLETAGFHERVEMGFGNFITPEELRTRNPRYFFEVFRNIPGVRVSAAGLMGTTIEFTVASVRGPTCTPRVFVDGIQVNVEMGLEAVVEVDQLAGVEVYSRPSQVPLQWGGSDSTCGVLLMWTR